jgi:hypothetical protein
MFLPVKGLRTDVFPYAVLVNKSYSDDVFFLTSPTDSVVILNYVVYIVCSLTAKACYVMAGDRCHVESGPVASQVHDVDDIDDDTHHDDGDVRLTR